MAKIAMSDKFMFVGHCEYQPKSWHSRNYIRGKFEPVMLSVPVIKGISINETKPLTDNHWRRKHLKAIEHAYHNRFHDYFDSYYPELESILMEPVDSLSDLNTNLIVFLMRCLEIETPIYDSDLLDIRGHKTKMLVEMCESLEGIDHYLSSPGETYVKPEEMNGYRHSFLEFKHPVYEQGYRDFMPNLSVIDLLFNCGPESASIVRGCASV